MTIEEVRNPKTPLKALIGRAKEIVPNFKFRNHSKAKLADLIAAAMENDVEAESTAEPVATPPVEAVEPVVVEATEDVDEDEVVETVEEVSPLDLFRADVKVALTKVQEENPDENPSTYRQALEVDELFEKYEEDTPLKDLGLAYMEVFEEMFPSEKPKKKRGRPAKKGAKKPKGEPGKRGRKATAMPTITPEMQAVLNDAEISQSEKFRRLFDMGLKVAHIVKATEAKHYSFVYGVIDKYRNKKAVAETTPTPETSEPVSTETDVPETSTPSAEEE